MKKTEEQVFVVGGEEEKKLPLPAARYGTWKRALSLLTKILRWRDIARTSLRLSPLPLPALRAEKILIRQAQEEMRQGVIRGGDLRPWRRKAGLTQLKPFLDEEGLLRGRGRLSQAACLPRDAREPLILLPEHHTTKLIIRHLHSEVLCHAGGVSYTLNHLLGRFWLPQTRQVVFQEIAACVGCKRRLCRPLVQPIGNLPALRFPQQPGDERPFAVTAVDCAGPFKVKRGHSFENHYLLLFTCCHI